jgi:hypothetical protein
MQMLIKYDTWYLLNFYKEYTWDCFQNQSEEKG